MRKNQPYKRLDRVEDSLRKIISETVQSKLHHHGLENVTITSVKVSPDLHHGKVYYRVLDLNARLETAKALAKAKPLIQKEFGRETNLRYTPVLEFEYDESLDHGYRIEELLRSAKSTETTD